MASPCRSIPESACARASRANNFRRICELTRRANRAPDRAIVRTALRKLKPSSTTCSHRSQFEDNGSQGFDSAHGVAAARSRARRVRAATRAAHRSRFHGRRPRQGRRSYPLQSGSRRDVDGRGVRQRAARRGRVGARSRARARSGARAGVREPSCSRCASARRVRRQPSRMRGGGARRRGGRVRSALARSGGSAPAGDFASAGTSFGAPVGAVMPSMSRSTSFDVYADGPTPRPPQLEIAAAEPPSNDVRDSFAASSSSTDLAIVPRPFRSDDDAQQ